MVTNSEQGRKELFGRFLRDRRGNVAIIFGVAAIPMVLMNGIAIDYAHDAMIRGRMTAVADAAALAATTPAMFADTTANAQNASIAMFQAQAALVQGANVNYASPNCSTTAPGLCVNVTDTTVTNGKVRQVTVTATVSVQNYFGALEGAPTTQFTVSSVANVRTAPNINFYLLLDASASMELPATTAGINTMVTKTGCALACHENNLNDSELLSTFPGKTAKTNYDSYTYAENNEIALRIDNMRAAAESVIAQSATVMDRYNATAPAGQQITYQMAAYTFTDSATQVVPLTPTTDANALPPGPGQFGADAETDCQHHAAADGQQQQPAGGHSAAAIAIQVWDSRDVADAVATSEQRWDLHFSSFCFRGRNDDDL